jgi:hypothetical protein
MTPSFGLSIDPATGTVSGTPSTAGDFDVSVLVRDAASVSASRNFRVSIMPVLNMSITALPPTLNPGDQPSFQVRVDVPGGFPADINGRLVLSFQADPALQNPTLPDPALHFSTDANITLPALITALDVQLSPGTSAGTITVSLVNLVAGGLDVTPPAPILATTQIAAGPPVISACIEQKTATSLRVRTEGVSSTREIKGAVFRFTQATGANLKTTEIPVADAGTRLFSPFYTAQTGFFRYVQTFDVAGDTNAIGTVSVLLENLKGQSAVAVASAACATP